MKIVRFGEIGNEKPGLINDKEQIVDISGIVKDITIDFITNDGLAKLKEIKLDDMELVSNDVRLSYPIANPSKLIGIGLNYSDHAKESNMPIPTEPIVFMKSVSAISGPNDNVVLPQGSKKSDWEVELAFVIGKKAKNISKIEALDHVFGYTICNDLSEREWQMEHGTQWSKGKSFDTFAPLGPYLVTPDEIKDAQNLEMWLDLNGKRMQSGNTGTMIFNISEILSYLSNFVTLYPGDVVTTGTPPGVGMGVKPDPIFLKKGDVMELGIENLGVQRQKII